MPSTQRGIVHLLPLFLGVVVVAALGYLVIFKGVVKNPLPGLIKTQTSVEPTATYENPLDKSSQYVNPFSEFKNPFDALK